MQSIVISSWNVRGLGNDVAKANVRSLIKESKPLVLLIQETKCQDWSNNLLDTIWDASNHDWASVNAICLSGGLLTVWDSNFFDMNKQFSSNHILWCRGVINSYNKRVNVVNVHGPLKDGEKVVFWSHLSKLVLDYGLEAICIMGDFNNIRDKKDREGCLYQDKDTEGFNLFIENHDLREITGDNFKFTWFGPRGKKSRLDRILVNDVWAENIGWFARGWSRRNSDHCPISLQSSMRD